MRLEAQQQNQLSRASMVSVWLTTDGEGGEAEHAAYNPTLSEISG